MTKYKFIKDEENKSIHHIEGKKVKYGDTIEFKETNKKMIENFIRHHYIEEVKNEDTSSKK